MTYDYTGSDQTYIVPGGCRVLTVKAWGVAAAEGPHFIYLMLEQKRRARERLQEMIRTPIGALPAIVAPRAP